MYTLHRKAEFECESLYSFFQESDKDFQRNHEFIASQALKISSGNIYKIISKLAIINLVSFLR